VTRLAGAVRAERRFDATQKLIAGAGANGRRRTSTMQRCRSG
jgi:hypothetical protein